MFFKRALVVVVAVGLVGALAGCGGQSAPTKIDAQTMSAYRVWRSRAVSEVSSDAWSEFNAAIQDIRLRAMTHGVSGEDAIDDAMCQQINGHTIDEVLIADYTTKVDELQQTAKQMKEMVDANALLVAKPGDDAAAEELDRRRSEQLARLNRVLDDVDKFQRRLAQLKGIVVTDETAARPTVAAAGLSREAALTEIHGMIDQRLDVAAMRYGAWPVKVDRTGKLLEGDAKTEFEAKHEAAFRNHHVVIPVRVRDEWWIYDAPVTQPTFSPSVTAHLTADDLQSVEQRWENSEAILWAREKAFVEPAEVADQKRTTRMQTAAKENAATPGGPQVQAPVVDQPKPVDLPAETPVIDTGLK